MTDVFCKRREKSKTTACLILATGWRVVVLDLQRRGADLGGKIGTLGACFNCSVTGNGICPYANKNTGRSSLQRRYV